MGIRTFFRDKLSKIMNSKGESASARQLKQAIKTAKAGRDPSDNITAVLYDFPIFLELAKTYIEDGDPQSAQAVIRTCFELRDEYSKWSGRREAYLIKRLAKKFIEKGDEQMAQKVLRKVRNFEHGVPVDQLSNIFVPDRELLKQALEEWDYPAVSKDDSKLS